MSVRKLLKNRNRAFRLLKQTHNMQHLIQYEKTQAVVRRTVRQAKGVSWRAFGSRVGRTTTVREIWGMIKRMGGEKKDWDFPTLISAVSDKEKAEVMAKSFAIVNSSENLSEVAKMRKEQTMAQYSEALIRKVATDHHLDPLLTIEELSRALRGQNQHLLDQICYLFFFVEEFGEWSIHKAAGIV